MMDEEFSDLAALLRYPKRPADEAFVNDIEWLIELDIAFERRRSATYRRWAVDLGSASAIGCVAFVLAGDPSAAQGAAPMLLAPLLAATAVPILWLLARSSTSAC